MTQLIYVGITKCLCGCDAIEGHVVREATSADEAAAIIASSALSEDRPEIALIEIIELLPGSETIYTRNEVLLYDEDEIPDCGD